MLAKLISAGQVVLLHHSSAIYLFYHGRVYFRPAASCFWQWLPEHHRMAYCPIWTLIDGDYESQGLTKYVVCPLHMAGPGDSSKPHSMEVVVEAEWGYSVGDASMEHGGVSTRVRSSFLPSIPVISFDRGLLLIVLCFASVSVFAPTITTSDVDWSSSSRCLVRRWSLPLVNRRSTLR